MVGVAVEQSRSPTLPPIVNTSSSPFLLYPRRWPQVIFMGDAKIEMHEAFIQFALYFGYVGLMSQSEKLRVWITSKLGQFTSKVADEGAAEAGKAEEGQAKRNDGIEGNDMNIDFKVRPTQRCAPTDLVNGSFQPRASSRHRAAYGHTP